MTDPLKIAPPKSIGRLEEERQTALRDEVARKNREELLRLIAEKDLWVRKEDFDAWRPTARVEGEITGVKAGLTIIATDGNVAYFEDAEDFDVFFGHIQCFSGEVRTLFSMPKEGVIKEGKDKPRKEKRHVRDALALLQELQAAALRRRWLRAAAQAYERVRAARQSELDRVSAYLAHYSVSIEQLATKLQESNEVSLEEAQKLVEKYKQAYPGLPARPAQDVSSRAEGVDAEIPVLSKNAEKTEGAE